MRRQSRYQRAERTESSPKWSPLTAVDRHTLRFACNLAIEYESSLIACYPDNPRDPLARQTLASCRRNIKKFKRVRDKVSARRLGGGS